MQAASVEMHRDDTFAGYTLPEPLVAELRSILNGQVIARGHPEFRSRTLIFNGNVKSPSKCVVIPDTAVDVSKVLKFCTKHALHPSIKAGGYGTAGWAINGDIVIDLSKLQDIQIEAPNANGSCASLRETPLANAKGKDRLSGFDIMAPALGDKRRRTSDPAAQTDLPRNQLVANFLHPDTDNPGAELPSPAIRRRVEFDRNVAPSRFPQDDQSFVAEDMLRQDSNDSLETSSFGTSGTELSKSPSTTSTGATSADALSSDETDSSVKESLSNLDLTSSRQERAAEILAAAPAGIYDSACATSLLIAPNLDAETPRAEAPQPQFSVRSSDPFGYMSSSLSVSSTPVTAPPRPRQGSYFQSSYAHGPPAMPTPAGTSSLTMSSGQSLMTGPFSSNNSPSSMFMSSNASPIHKQAFVTFGSGVKQKEIDLFTSGHPLPAVLPNGDFSQVPYHVPLAAHPVGSSVMLLGGFGFLSRLHGLSIDALVEAEVVLADGRIVYANANENQDLFWALRGAGPAFGVVTRYKAIAYPVPIVFAGNLIYDFDPLTAARLIKHFRDCVKSAPRELYANVLLTAGPQDKGSLVVVQLCYVGIGASEKGKEFLQAIEAFKDQKCVLNEVSEKSFLAQQDSVAQILRGKVGRQWFIRSALITSLPDEIVESTVTEFANTPVGCTWLFELAGGAVADNTDTCLPKEQREAAFTIAAFHQWELDDDDPACVETAEQWIYRTLKPVSIGGPLPAFIGRHEPTERVIGCYGQNWSRLCEIKRNYDPNGLFKHNFWPLDVRGEVVEPRSHEPPSP